jgi:hypothetical protein
MRTASIRTVGLVATAAAVIVVSQRVPVMGQQGGMRPGQRFAANSAEANLADPQMQAAFDEESAARHSVAELVDRYSRTENQKDRTELKSQLGKALDDEFVAQHKRRSLELDRVEAQLKKVRDLLRRRIQERQTIVDNRLEQVVREAEGLGWSEPSGFPREGFRPAQF